MIPAYVNPFENVLKFEDKYAVKVEKKVVKKKTTKDNILDRIESSTNGAELPVETKTTSTRYYPKWEYKRERIRYQEGFDQIISELMNRMGKNGWEAYSTFTNDEVEIIHFKRQIS